MAVRETTTRSARARGLPGIAPAAAARIARRAGDARAAGSAAIRAWPRRAVKGEVSVAVTGEGFARLIFRLAEEVESEVRTANGIVIVAFKQPVDVAVDRMVSGAGEYIGAARRDPDGKAIRIALARKVRVNTMAAGERLFVDLLPEPWTGVVPGLPQDVVEELTKRARDAEKRAVQQLSHRRSSASRRLIRVRVGKQPTFTRYSFDLPRGVRVANNRDDNQAHAGFRCAAEIRPRRRASRPAVQRGVDRKRIRRRFRLGSFHVCRERSMSAASVRKAATLSMSAMRTKGGRRGRRLRCAQGPAQGTAQGIRRAERSRARGSRAKLTRA